MKKEAVDEAASEAIRKAEQDKAWRKREEVSILYIHTCVCVCEVMCLAIKKAEQDHA